MKFLFFSFLLLALNTAQASDKQFHKSLAEVELQQAGIEFDQLELDKDIKSSMRDFLNNKGKFLTLDFDSKYTSYTLKAFNGELLTECILIAKENGGVTFISIAECQLKDPRIKDLRIDYLIKG